LRFIVLTAEKPASHRYDVENGWSASVAIFVTMGHSRRRNNQKEAISVEQFFSFSLLSCFISVSSSFSAAVNSADSNAINTTEYLTQSKEDASGDGKYFSMFLRKLYRIKSRFLSSLQLFVS
jgi:hypothetical protein